MLASDDLIVTHVSTHVSLLNAIRSAKQPRIQTIIQLTVDAVRKLKSNPRIAVAGLNPHAGEHGLFRGRGDKRNHSGRRMGAGTRIFRWKDLFRRTRCFTWQSAGKSSMRSSACTTIRVISPRS